MSSRGAEPAKYALDTNIFINAFRDNAAANALDAFFRRALVVTFLSSVVVQELGAGARARKDALLLQRAILAPFERRNRIVAPSAAAFKESGRILADLVAREGADAIRGNRSLANDTLLAASCRERGLTLVSSDADFDRIRPLLVGFRIVKPWP